MKKTFFVYDDTVLPSSSIQNIVGSHRFSEVVLKRKNLKAHFTTELLKFDFVKYNYYSSLEQIDKTIFADIEDVIVLIPSYVVINNSECFAALIGKLKYIKDNAKVSVNNGEILIFSSGNEFLTYLNSYNAVSFKNINSNAFADISETSSFINFITSGFDARFFNTLHGNQYTIVKTSTDKVKIKKEYLFYSLLPENMKMWFVFPFDYTENEAIASYTMERYNTTDLAIRWIHNAISIEEMDHILSKLFYFITKKQSKKISDEDKTIQTQSLFFTKVEERIAQLKRLPEFAKIEKFVELSTDYNGIDDLFTHYKRLYDKTRGIAAESCVSVVSHGDLCFSNILFDSTTDLLKLIDPKGALNENDLWMSPYYDIAKLSHSLCGKYDFFNANLFNITIEGDFKATLNIAYDNRAYIDLFKKYLKDNGFNYILVRLYETSLFLSMLPLHIDNPHKVFGFILNAIEIMKELEQCIQN